MATFTKPDWANTTLVSGGLAAAIGELKAKRGGELQAHGSSILALDLVESRADSKGVTIQVYRPAGRPQYVTATVD